MKGFHSSARLKRSDHSEAIMLHPARNVVDTSASPSAASLERNADPSSQHVIGYVDVLAKRPIYLC
jgi:hypothetical protein